MKLGNKKVGKNIKILVTGGDGYVGSKLVAGLRANGFEVEIFDKPKDILNKEELEEAVKGKDAVFHLAALAELEYARTHPEETYAVNVQGTENICELCAKYNVLLNFISTACLYGEPLEAPSKESDLINPIDIYAMSKAAGEYIVKIWHLANGLKYNILRLGTVYGPSSDKKMRSDMCVQAFLDKTSRGEPLIIKGDGRQARNFIHIEDAVDGFISVIERGIIGETINIAGNEIISINEIAKLAIELGISKKIEYATERKHDFKNQNISLEKAKKLLNWQPKVKFRKGIEEFYKWLLE